MPYKFEREELLQLLIRAYDEGNYGFLDLSESVAEKIIEENESKYEEKFDGILPNWPTDNMPTVNDLLNTQPYTPSTTHYPYQSMSSSSFTISTGETIMADGESFRVNGEPPISHEDGVFITRNFSDEPVLIDTIHIESGVPPNSNDIIDNLVVHNSNQVEADGSLVQKQLD